MNASSCFRLLLIAVIVLAAFHTRYEITLSTVYEEEVSKIEVVKDKRVVGLHTTAATYQERIRQRQWYQRQCKYAQTILEPNRPMYPYLEIPPTPQEKELEFNAAIPPDTKIVFLCPWWTPDEIKAPPFFNYWISSAMANQKIADFFLFVPDEAHAKHLKAYLPPTNTNIHIRIVGDFLSFYRKRLGKFLLKAHFELDEWSISRLKPMLGHVFEPYTRGYSHWAWNDMDVIFGNLTKFVAAPLHEGFDIITLAAVDDFGRGQWETHMCHKDIVFAGQTTIFTNTNASRTYFEKCQFGRKLPHLFDEQGFPETVYELPNVKVAHVFAQVTDQFRALEGKHFVWTRAEDGGAQLIQTKPQREVALVHLLLAKRLIKYRSKMERRIFPYMSEMCKFDMYLNARPRTPWKPHKTCPDSLK